MLDNNLEQMQSEGYAKVAQLMGDHPEFAIFRRFRALNMQDMLYLQAEITHLEADLRKITNDDVKRRGRQNHAYDWWSMAHGMHGEGDTEQWEKVLEIRQKLEKYSKRTRHAREYISYDDIQN